MRAGERLDARRRRSCRRRTERPPPARPRRARAAATSAASAGRATASGRCSSRPPREPDQIRIAAPAAWRSASSVPVEDLARRRAHGRRGPGAARAARPRSSSTLAASLADAELVAQHRERARRQLQAPDGSPQPHHFISPVRPTPPGRSRSIPSSASSRRAPMRAAHHRRAQLREPAQGLLARQRHLGPAVGGLEPDLVRGAAERARTACPRRLLPGVAPLVGLVQRKSARTPVPSLGLEHRGPAARAGSPR